MRIGLILMASGFASRFGANKLLAEVDGAPLIRRAMSAYPPELFHRAVVVSQYPEILTLAESLGYTAVPNPDAAEGISASIRLGLAALGNADAALFAVSDQPWLTTASVQRVLSALESAPGRIPALSWRGRKGNPCLFPREFFAELSALTGDRGGGAVIRAHPDRLLPVEAASERELLDVDAPSDLN